jgi:hypothetical protein
MKCLRTRSKRVAVVVAMVVVHVRGPLAHSWVHALSKPELPRSGPTLSEYHTKPTPHERSSQLPARYIELVLPRLEEACSMSSKWRFDTLLKT